VLLRNGNRLVGEIKKLLNGKLTIKTDDLGTVDAKWDHVTTVTSRDFFELETSDGTRYFGSLQPAAEPEKLDVVGQDSTATVEVARVVRLIPLGGGFFQRLDGSVDLGFSFTKANRATQWSLGADASYRTRRHLHKLSFNSLYNKQEGVERTSRNDLVLQYGRFLGPRWLAVGFGRFQQNEELGLDLRSEVVGGAARFVVQTNRYVLAVVGGLGYTREEFQAAAGQNNMEALAALQFQMFRYDFPEMGIFTNFYVAPGLSQAGRVRIELDTEVRFELVKDFFIGLTFFDSYDSDPPTADLEHNDYGVTTSLGLSF
jgi:hypothetical protein